MYDALLEDFEEKTRTRVSGQPFDESAVLAAEEAPSDPTDSPNVDATAEDNSGEEMLAGIDETESWSDDPVRMYLTQMGEIPLLTRQQEISLAKKIEITRREFRTGSAVITGVGPTMVLMAGPQRGNVGDRCLRVSNC